MGILLFGYKSIPEFKFENIQPQARFSIVIPFRNEAQNLPYLLQSLKKLKYPNNLFEIIFIDDESDDKSVEIIETNLKSQNYAWGEKTLQFKIIKNKRFSASPKKDAITTAINIAEYEWILTTDADCKFSDKWLEVFNAFIQKKNPIMIAGLVSYSEENSFINHFQKMDNLSLQLVTMGSFGLYNPILCNGANLAYKKEVFNAVGGFSENNHIASGDDIFLLEKLIKKYPKAVHFLKSSDAIVITNSEKNWNRVIQQRIRWASKTIKQKNILSKGLGILVFLTNLFIIVGFIVSLFETDLIPYFLIILVMKMLIDFIVIKMCAAFFNKKNNLFVFIACELIYPIITVLVVLGSIKGSYTWKGRKINNIFYLK